MARPTRAPIYFSDRLFLASEAADEATLQHVRIAAADLLGMATIHRLVVETFPDAPRAERLRDLETSGAACIVRLAGRDARFTEASDGMPYVFAEHISRPPAYDPQDLELTIRQPYFTLKGRLQTSFGDNIIEVTEPSLFNDPRHGTAYARALMEYGGVITPSDAITGDVERARYAAMPDVLNVMDTAEQQYPRLFVFLNGTVDYGQR